MHKIFKIGDVCVGQYFLTHTEYNGMECEVIGGLELRRWYSESGSAGEDICYRVRWANGYVSAQQGYNLRPKRPPKRAIDEVVSWETVGWMPFEVKFDRAIKQSLRDQMREKA